MILHIANDYGGSLVYKHLIQKIDDQGIKQIIYVPIREKYLANRNKIVLQNGSDNDFVYSLVLQKYRDKVFYQRKIKRIKKDILSRIELSNLNFIHAHTWFSDGGGAYELSKETGIPFVVTVRNTDLNIFYKYMLHLRSYGLKILRAAERIIFISEAYYKRFQAIVGNDKYDLLVKSVVIPNGVDHFWLENAGVINRTKEELPFNLLYVGRFTKGKNLINLIKAVELLNKVRHTVSLTLVGGGGNNEQNVISKAKQTAHVYYIGEIKDKRELLNIYKNHDIFVMPSKGETFGLVYVEALLQGLPILYTQNEGIDGMYDAVGEAVAKFSVEEIAYKINVLMESYDKYVFDIPSIQANHNWKTIAERYIMMYKDIK